MPKKRTTTKRTASKATTRKATTSKRKTGDMLVVGSKVKDAIRTKKCNVGGDALEGINEWIHWLIEQGAERAKANGRKTIRRHDFIA